MPYDIIFDDIDEPNRTGPAHKERAVGENVFLANLPQSPKVFALFYRGGAETDEVEGKLRTLGQRTGDNLYVNIGTLVDPDYSIAVQRFKIKRLPAIVVTAIAPLAGAPTGESAYVRLDGAALFGKPDELVRGVEQLCNLFLCGRIAEAVLAGWVLPGKAAAAAALGKVWDIVRPVIAWVAQEDISLEFASIKISAKPSGRS